MSAFPTTGGGDGSRKITFQARPLARAVLCVLLRSADYASVVDIKSLALARTSRRQYNLDLRFHDHRKVAGVLAEMAVVEPGPNLQHQQFR